jgi:metal-responsive CopG/Arc/MetJ family transcriptional regulator
MKTKRSRKDIQISVRLNRELLQAIDQAAEKDARNRSQIVILAVRQYLKTIGQSEKAA